jgi:hypothetical protein
MNKNTRTQLDLSASTSITLKDYHYSFKVILATSGKSMLLQECFRDPATRLGSLVTHEQPLQVAGNDINFQIYTTPLSKLAQGRCPQCVRNDIDIEDRSVHRIYRQADTVNANRSFFCNIPREVWRNLYTHPLRATLRPAFDECTHPVDMPADQVPAEPRRGCQGLFEIHGAARLQITKDRPGQGLCRHIGPEPVTGQLDCGQADATDSHAVTGLQIRQIERAAFNPHTQIRALRFKGGNAAYSFYDACEHKLNNPNIAMQPRERCLLRTLFESPARA